MSVPLVAVRYSYASSLVRSYVEHGSRSVSGTVVFGLSSITSRSETIGWNRERESMKCEADKKAGGILLRHVSSVIDVFSFRRALHHTSQS